MHADFECRAWSAINDNSGLIGRPYGGLANMWHKSLNVKWLIKCTLANHRIAVLDISDSLRKLFTVKKRCFDTPKMVDTLLPPVLVFPNTRCFETPQCKNTLVFGNTWVSKHPNWW